MKAIVPVKKLIITGVIAGIFGSSVDWEVWQFWSSNAVSLVSNNSIEFYRRRSAGIRQKFKARS